MSDFSRQTIIEAISMIESWSHSHIERFALMFGLEEVLPEDQVSRQSKANIIIKHLLANPDELGPRGSALSFEIIERLVEDVPEQVNDPFSRWAGEVSYDPWAKFKHSLARDGYKVKNGKLVSTLPEQVQLPEKENEVTQLLGQFGFSIAEGHLEQAISAHTRGDWAAANSQLRSFVESLFDSVAETLIDVSSLPPPGHQRREELARISPPFFEPSINEWEIGNKGGFVQGFWRRLHANGSHPGLSSKEDSTFRLHLVILVTHHFLNRLNNRA